jgi:regulator of replication initiation timing
LLSCVFLWSEVVAQIIEDYMVITKIVLRSDIDNKLKRIIEKLYYRSKELIFKNGIEECYMEEINSLKRKLGEQTETTKKLVVENKSLRQTLKSRCELQSDDSFVLTKSIVNKSFDTTQSYEDLLNSLSYLIQVFSSFNKDETSNSLLKTMEYNFKKAVSCESMIRLTKKTELQYEGVLFDKPITVPLTEKQVMARLVIVCNNPTTENLLINKVQAVTAYAVKNYLVVPCRHSKEKTATEFLVFMNKKDARGGIINFNKSDEIIGMLSSYMYLLMTQYYNVQSNFDKLRKVRQVTFEIVYELLSFVHLLLH